MEAEEKTAEKTKEYEDKLKSRQAAAEEKTAKKRSKRQKKKVGARAGVSDVVDVPVLPRAPIRFEQQPAASGRRRSRCVLVWYHRLLYTAYHATTY